jgi:Methyltransferase FkbM domain
LATLKSFYGVNIGEPSGSTAAATAEVVEVFELLKPKASQIPLIRIGGDLDGSYLVPDDLDGIAACFSPGVNRIKYFEDFLSDRYGIQSHMCDLTCDVEKLKTPLKPEMQTFVKKWLDVSPGEDSICLEDWLQDHDSRGDLLLQMDIEGAEYRNILATSEGTLARFRVIVIEVHGLGKMLEAPILREVIAPFFQKLGRSFTSVHAHPNNCCGEFTVPDTDIRIPNVLELTLIRNDHFVPARGPAALPHPLDVSRNVPRKAPLFLSEAWCDYQRPLESRVKILEDMLRYREDVGASSADGELSGALSLTMQSLQTLNTLVAPAPKRDGNLVEVARGRRYELSSAYGTSSRTGVVRPRGSYFFHTGFGKDQSIRVDLGRRRRVRRIEVTNRQGGFQERAKHVFAVLTDDGPSQSVRRVFPIYETELLPGGAWQECEIEAPDVIARYVTITSPMNTALHFSDLRIYAADGDGPIGPLWKRVARRALRSVKGRIRRLRPSR